MIKIAVDTLGGDRSPDANIDGAIVALNQNTDISIVLAGDKEVIESKLKSKRYDKSRLEILHAPDVISCNEKPTEAFKHKPDSSLCKTIELLKTDDSVQAMVTTGSTGALLVGAVVTVGRIRGVRRPGFCPIVPTINKSFVGICDSGANMDSDATQLKQFAIMGNLYMKKTFGIESPRVALLNVGVEEEKGDMLRKEVYQMLKQLPDFNFVGNMESRDLMSGNYDLIVCDGFAGNVLVKSAEGACLAMLKLLKTTFTKNFKNKIGALMLKKDIVATRNYMDYNNYGGAVLLGVQKTIVKGHGSSKDTAVTHCIEQAYNMEKNNLRQAISDALTDSIM